MEWLDLFSSAQQALFEHVVGPLTFALGLGQLLEDAFDATGWLLVGLLQLVVLLTVIGPLQRWRPVEPVTDQATVCTDVIYTLIHRLGLMRLVFFFTLTPLLDEVFSWWRVQGLGTLHLDDVWPGVTDIALVSFFMYLLLFDFIDYWMHRAQHQWNWWWQLHAMHHAQRQMTMWSDNRNHLIDDLIRDVVWAVVAQLVGVPPAQFVALVAVAQLSESLQHANLRLWFGSVGERLWVSPRFHRLHHTIGIGHETQVTSVGAMSAAGPSQGAKTPEGLSPAAPSLPVQTWTGRRAADSGGGTSSAAHAVASVGAMSAAGPTQGAKAPSGGSAAHAVASVGARLGGHNFGVLLPWWDMLFGTANFEVRYDPTGVRDQVEQGRDYGRGFWSQQWLGVLRLLGKA